MATTNYAAPTVNVRPTGDYRPTSTLAVVSLVTSLFGFVTFGLGSVIAIVTGHFAIRDTRGEAKKGRGSAVAGLLIGYVGVVPIVVLSIIVVLGFATSGGGTNTGY